MPRVAGPVRVRHKYEGIARDFQKLAPLMTTGGSMLEGAALAGWTIVIAVISVMLQDRPRSGLDFFFYVLTLIGFGIALPIWIYVLVMFLHAIGA